METTPISYKPRIFRSSKRKNDTILFEEPLISVDLTPTGEVDPLLVENDLPEEDIPLDDEFYTSGFSIFSTPVSRKEDNNKKPASTSKGNSKEGEVSVKQEAEDDSGIRLKTSDDRPRTPTPPPVLDLSGVNALREALSDIKFLCPKCCFRSSMQADLEEHLYTHRSLSSKPRPCGKCFFVAKTVRELATHRKVAHPRTLPEDLPTLPTGEFKCPHCDFISFHKSNLRSHLKVHTQTTVFSCDKCPYTSINKVQIENHTLRHLQSKKSKKWKYECKHCGLRERTEKFLARHLILHGEGEMLQCTLCPYKTPYSHIITQHTKTCHGITMPRVPRNSNRGRRTTRRTRNKDDEDYVPTEHVQLEFKPRRRLRTKEPSPKPDTEDSEKVSSEKEDKETISAPASSSDDSSSDSDSSDSDSEDSSDKSPSGDESTGATEKGDDSGSESHYSGGSEAKRAKLDDDARDRREPVVVGEDSGKTEEEQESNKETEAESKAVLVLKRKGDSFTCVTKDDH